MPWCAARWRNSTRLDEYRMEFVEWLALYKTWTSFDEKYRQLVARQPVALQIKANLEFSYA